MVSEQVRSRRWNERDHLLYEFQGIKKHMGRTIGVSGLKPVEDLPITRARPMRL